MIARTLSSRFRLAGIGALIALVLAGCTSTLPGGGKGASAGVEPAETTTVNAAVPTSAGVDASQETTIAAEWRELWQEHATWSRTVMLGVMNGLPGASQATARLDHNTTEMERLLTPVAGKSRAQRFGALMREHAEIEASMLRAMKADETSEAASAEKEWYANGYAIAALANKMAPGLDLATIDAMFKSHLATTKQEAEDRMAGDFHADILSAERVQRQVRMMADAMMQGIVDAQSK